MSGIGIMIHKSIPYPERLTRLNPKWVLYMTSLNWWEDDFAKYYRYLKELLPGHIPIVRFYNSDVMGETPQTRARQFCGLLTAIVGIDEPIDAIMGNELDLAGEHGGHKKAIVGVVDSQGGEAVAYDWHSQEGLWVISGWLALYADAHRDIREQDTLHLPACSGKMEWLGWLAAMPLSKYDVVDRHVYEMTLRDYAAAINGKPVFISEWGNPEQKDSYTTFARELGSRGNTLFVWHSPTLYGDPPVDWGIAGDEELVDKLADINSQNTHENVDIKEDKMAEFKWGFKEVVEILGREVVGEPTENEHSFSTQAPLSWRSIQETTRGLMYWRSGLPSAFYVLYKQLAGEEEAPPPMTVGQQIVEEARKWIGTLNYEWGDKTTADDPGMDCSGFVDMIWAEVTGEPVADGGGTWFQIQKAAGYGRLEEIDALSPGTLCFWETPGVSYPTHIGIATGEGTIIDLSLAVNRVAERSIEVWRPHWWGAWRLPL